VKALAKGDTATASKLAQEAIKIEPREARFQELLGDIALSEKKSQAALGYYDKAIKMQPDYFKPHVQSGVALFNMGKKAEAEPFLKRANELLPTAPGHALMVQIEEERGNLDAALQDYQMAAGSDSDIGKQAAERAVRLDLPRNPAKYIEAGALPDNAGNLFAVVQNDTNVPMARVRIHVVKYDAQTGQPIAQSRSMTINGVEPGKRNQIAIGERISNPQEARLYKVVVEAAELAK
jgi:beta-barrel assembly-enhancing protease